jgi:Ca2+:H+ antiporter
MEEKKPPFGPSNIGQNGSISHQQLHTQQQAAPKSHFARSSGGSAGQAGIRDSQLYKRILGQSIKQAGLGQRNLGDSRVVSTSSSAPHAQTDHPPYIVPPKSSGGDSTIVPDHSSQRRAPVAGLSEGDNNNLIRTVAEIAATAAAVAARDATRAPLRTSISAQTVAHPSSRHTTLRATRIPEENEEIVVAEVAAHTQGGGHDAPNWSKLKSAIILLGATLLYAIIAEILVNTVDVVLESVDIDEKFLGITLFALVPNTTEFLVRIILIATFVTLNMNA